MHFDSRAFSIKTVPDSWVQAEADAGGNDGMPLPAHRTVSTMPIRDDADALTGTLAALAMAVITGVTWYLFETQDVIVSAWSPVVIGVLLATAIRLGTGGRHGDVRATIGVIFYFLTVFAVSYFIEAYDYELVFGRGPDLGAAQQEIVRDRLTHPDIMLGWMAGLFATLQTGVLLTNRRR